MGFVLAVLIDRLIKATESAKDLSEEDLKAVMEIDNLIREDLLKHYLEDKS